MNFINTVLLLSLICIVLIDHSVEGRPNRYILVPEDSPFLAGNNAKKERRAGPPKFVLVREDSHLLYPSRGRNGRDAGDGDEAPANRDYVERKPPPPQPSKSYGDDSPANKEIILVPYQKTNVYRSREEDEENSQQPEIFSPGQQISEEVTHVETNSQEPNVKYVTKLVTTSEKEPETEKALYYEQPEEEEEPNREQEISTNQKPQKPSTITVEVTDDPSPEVHALQRGYQTNKYRKQLHEDPYHHHQHHAHHYHPYSHPSHIHRRRHLHQLLYHHPHTHHTHVPGGFGQRGGRPYHVHRQEFHYDSPNHPHFLRDYRR